MSRTVEPDRVEGAIDTLPDRLGKTTMRVRRGTCHPRGADCDDGVTGT